MARHVQGQHLPVDQAQVELGDEDRLLVEDRPAMYIPSGPRSRCPSIEKGLGIGVLRGNGGTRPAGRAPG